MGLDFALFTGSHLRFLLLRVLDSHFVARMKNKELKNGEFSKVNASLACTHDFFFFFF